MPVVVTRGEENPLLGFGMLVGKQTIFLNLNSVSARACHCGNPALQSDGPQKNEKRANLAHSFYKTAGLTQA